MSQKSKTKGIIYEMYPNGLVTKSGKIIGTIMNDVVIEYIGSKRNKSTIDYLLGEYEKGGSEAVFVQMNEQKKSIRETLFPILDKPPEEEDDNCSHFFEVLSTDTYGSTATFYCKKCLLIINKQTNVVQKHNNSHSTGSPIVELY